MVSPRNEKRGTKILGIAAISVRFENSPNMLAMLNAGCGLGAGRVGGELRFLVARLAVDLLGLSAADEI